MRNPHIVVTNPDRINIFLGKKKKDSNMDITRTMEDIYMPECQRLSAERHNYPVTVIYMPLQFCGDASDVCFSLFDNKVNLENTLFGILYSQQDDKVKTTILDELKKEDPRIRLIFCSAALGMGFDSPCITRVIHAAPPRSMNMYIQQTGRAGRRNQPSEAILFYNNSDIASNVHNMDEAMVTYCKNSANQCLRVLLLSNYGFAPKGNRDCMCCTVCRENCKCDRCS